MVVKINWPRPTTERTIEAKPTPESPRRWPSNGGETIQSMNQAKIMLYARVDAWNATHPVGCRIVYTDGSGHRFHTVTRGLALPLHGKRACVLIEGKEGYRDIDRITIET